MDQQFKRDALKLTAFVLMAGWGLGLTYAALLGGIALFDAMGAL